MLEEDVTGHFAASAKAACKRRQGPRATRSSRQHIPPKHATTPELIAIRLALETTITPTRTNVSVCDTDNNHHGRACAQTEKNEFTTRESFKPIEEPSTQTVIRIAHKSQSGAQLPQSSSNSSHISRITVTSK
jgi:hypothetical protein